MATAEPLLVRHSRGEYPVRFLAAGEVTDHMEAEAVVVTDRDVSAALGLDLALPCLKLEPGESTKNLKAYESVAEWLVQQGVNRQSRIVALGGGVIGDLVGFVAATYMRGIPYVQIPTSLLAMVDSAVGGKVAVDLRAGKNLLGAFWPPEEVWVCHEFLATLPERHLTNGMAEVLKYGAIMDAGFFSEFVRKPVRPHDPRLLSIARHCIDLKRRVVEEDEYETTGLRATLNFGHTIGHAIEQVLEYERLLHGEAVAIGMVAEAQLGERLGITDMGSAELLQQAFLRQGLPTAIPSELSADALLQAMARDKKATKGSLNFSLLTRIGECKLFSDVPVAAVRSVLPA